MKKAVSFVTQWAARGLMLALGVVASVSVNSYAQNSILYNDQGDTKLAFYCPTAK